MKDDVLRQGEHVHARTEAAGVSVKIEQLREEWKGMEDDLSKERGRLEKIMKLWKDYDRKQEEMYEWLTRILSSLHALEHQDKTIDVVKSQISLIQVSNREILNKSLFSAIHSIHSTGTLALNFSCTVLHLSTHLYALYFVFRNITTK